MNIKQLSVFIENKSGALLRVFELLKEANIQLVATTIADTMDYGICRIICNEPQRAYDMLKEAGVSVALNDVFAVELDNRPGSAADAISLFAKEGIDLTYLYTFLFQGKGILIFRTNDRPRAQEIIEKNGLKDVTL
ncbi:MAG: amino acid-binding protein [Prevotella sp.]|nr:amino acid-binding protein [Prevotella sp.]MBO5205133.1 amino acid-binding protein [Prevotella sp.]